MAFETVQSVPLVAVLKEFPFFGGRSRIIVQDTRRLYDQDFDLVTSSIRLHKGPDYDAVTASQGFEPTAGFYAASNYYGDCLVLGEGEYQHIFRLFNFDNAIALVKFNPTKERFPKSVRKPATFSSIPLVVELYKDANFNLYGKMVAVIENIPDLGYYLGSEWNDSITSVKVKRGPNYVAGKKVELHRDVNYTGGAVALEPENYPDLRTSHGFSDLVSSVRFV